MVYLEVKMEQARVEWCIFRKNQTSKTQLMYLQFEMQ